MTTPLMCVMLVGGCSAGLLLIGGLVVQSPAPPIHIKATNRISQNVWLAQLVEWASHAQRLCPRCSGPRIESWPIFSKYWSSLQHCHNIDIKVLGKNVLMFCFVAQCFCIYEMLLRRFQIIEIYSVYRYTAKNTPKLFKGNVFSFQWLHLGLHNTLKYNGNQNVAQCNIQIIEATILFFKR